MATKLQFANNASVNIAGAILATTTNLVLPAGTGALFPTASVLANTFFKATIEDRRTSPVQREIVHVLQRSGDVVSIIRGQEGTTPLDFAAGAAFSNRLTAGTLEQLVADLQEFSGFYVGPYPDPPTSYPNGDPLQPGSLYYNTTTLLMYVWNGTDWVTFKQASPTVAGEWVFDGVTGETVLTDLDRNAKMLDFPGNDPDPIVWVFKNGLFLTRGVDFTVATSPASVTLTTPEVNGEVYNVVYMLPASMVEPGGINVTRALLTPDFDGTTTTFVVNSLALDAVFTPANTTDVEISLDGIIQEPGVAYVVNGSGEVEFLDPPVAGTAGWVLFYTSPSSGGTGGGGGGPITAGDLPRLTIENRFTFPGLATDHGASAEVGQYIARPQTIPAGMTDSGAGSTTHPGADTTYTVKYDRAGSRATIGTVVHHTDGTTTLAAAASTDLLAGDILLMIGPASPDATMAGFCATILSTYQPA